VDGVGQWAGDPQDLAFGLPTLFSADVAEARRSAFSMEEHDERFGRQSYRSGRSGEESAALAARRGASRSAPVLLPAGVPNRDERKDDGVANHGDEGRHWRCHIKDRERMVRTGPERSVSSSAPCADLRN
jgi:hypothetical protein